MKTVCPGGWSRHFTHAPEPGANEPGASHGMCERCKLALEAEMDGLKGLPLAQYCGYLTGVMDPRD